MDIAAALAASLVRAGHLAGLREVNDHIGRWCLWSVGLSGPDTLADAIEESPARRG